MGSTFFRRWIGGFLAVCLTLTGMPALCVSGAEPAVSAQSCILMEAVTGEILYEKQAQEQRPMASTTKIMTTLLCLESGDLDTEFPVDTDAIHVEGSSMGLVEGDIVTKRVCAYTSLTAILDSDVSEYTSCAILVDKEEIGSVGATGAHSLFFENTVAEMLLKMGIDSFVQTRLTMSRSKMLSSDVSAGVDPLFVSVNDKKNAAYLGNGIVFNKYTGSRGKSGSNDASAEYVAQVRTVIDNANIHYQTAELGRVDQGGGGTIAYILGNYNMDVIDAGIAVLNMHAPMEIVSKVDVYETYQAYKAFLKDA